MRRETLLSLAAALAGAALAVLQPTGAAARQGRPPDRVGPPAAIDCPRDRLTAYTGRVIAWSRAAGRTTIRVRTDWDTEEGATLRHPGTDDPSRWFLMRGAAFTPEDWPRIESARGRIRDGMRATIWACDDNRPVVIDWSPPRE